MVERVVESNFESFDYLIKGVDAGVLGESWL